MREGWRTWASVWEEHRTQAEEYREIDHHRVLVLAHSGGGRGKTSGLELGHHGGGGATLFHIRAAKITRLLIYWEREHAFAELGLPPEDG
jgi:hypothetical protein